MPAGRFVVRGMVQGVGFRWFVSREARQLGLTGWVTNLADGTVEVVAYGTAPALARLEAALQRGPPAARVERVEKSASPHEMDGLNSFEVR
jgi:acylphosphatase